MRLKEVTKIDGQRNNGFVKNCQDRAVRAWDSELISNKVCLHSLLCLRFPSSADKEVPSPPGTGRCLSRGRLFSDFEGDRGRSQCLCIGYFSGNFSSKQSMSQSGVFWDGVFYSPSLFNGRSDITCIFSRK